MNTGSSSSDYEYTLVQKTNVVVFKIPPLSTSKGHYLNDWKEMIWEGTVRVVSRNNNLVIVLLNKNNTLFGECPIPPQSERFTVSFTDFKERADHEKDPNKFMKNFDLNKDYSLKEGQKMKLNLNIKDKDPEDNEFNLFESKFFRKKTKSTNFNDFSDFSSFSNPPKQTNNFTTNFSDWGNFADFSTNTTQTKPTTNNPPKNPTKVEETNLLDL